MTRPGSPPPQAKAIAAGKRWVLPVTHYIWTSPFGMRWGVLHPGDDLAVPSAAR